MKHCITFLLLSFFLINGTQSQTRKQLEKKRFALKKEMKKVNQLLFDTQNKRTNALDALDNLNQKITVREKLITTINLEAKALIREITKNKKKIIKLTADLTLLKKDYAAMIFKSYKSKSQQSRLMFLLSSANFYQAHKRVQYMKQYTSFRKKQGEEIVLQTNIIRKIKDSLFKKKVIKDTLILNEEKQKKAIENDKKDKEELISTIKKKESSYKDKLKKITKEEEVLARQIDKLIKEAIARENRKRKKGTKKTYGFILSPKAKALAAKFESNKGSLPWPVDKGIVTRKFGIQKHPTIGGITINSPGVHFRTSKNAQAKAIFNGTVFAILTQSQGKKMIMVKHGNFISTYNNLENVSVKKGDVIKVGESLGKIFTDKVNGKTTLVFILSKNTKRLNPLLWLNNNTQI